MSNSTNCGVTGETSFQQLHCSQTLETACFSEINARHTFSSSQRSAVQAISNYNDCWRQATVSLISSLTAAAANLLFALPTNVLLQFQKTVLAARFLTFNWKCLRENRLSIFGNPMPLVFPLPPTIVSLLFSVIAASSSSPPPPVAPLSAQTKPTFFRARRNTIDRRVYVAGSSAHSHLRYQSCAGSHHSG